MITRPTQAQLDAVIHAPNVAASTELEEGIGNGNAFVLLASQKFDADIQSFPEQQPAVGQLLITQGRALSGGDPVGIVINQQFADAHQLRVGDAVSLVTPQGLVQVHVHGLSIDVNNVRGDESAVPSIFLLRTTFERLYPHPDRWVVGLRLVDPSALVQTTQTILQRLQAEGYREKSLWNYNWLDNQDQFVANTRLTAILLLLFGIVGLVAAGVIVANLVIGQVLAQQRELGILKALGFTPLQLVRTLVLEYLLLGLLGAVAGLGLVALFAPVLLAALGASLGVPVPPQYDLGTGAQMLAGVLLVIAVCTTLPAWRAGRTRVVDAIRPGGVLPEGGRARLAGLMFGRGLPVTLALGVRGITARPLRSFLVLLTLILGVLTVIFGLGFGVTLDKYAHDPALNGIFSDVDVTAGLYSPRSMQSLLASRPEVAYSYNTYQADAQLSHGGDLGIYYTDGDTRRITATLTSGRWFKANADELVVSDYALQHLGLHLGERIPLLVIQRGGQQTTVPYTIVGTLYMTQNPYKGYAPLGSLTAHVPITTDERLAVTEYEVTLHSGVSAQAFAQTLQQVTAARVGVKVYDLTPQGGVEQGLLVMLFLSIALMVVAGVGMLNAMVLSTRERYRELATLKTIGLTPRQVLSSVINGAIVLGILAVVIGIPLGLWLNTMAAPTLVSSIGGPPNIQISINWLGLALLIPVTALVAALGAYLPARWAARVPAAEVLRYE